MAKSTILGSYWLSSTSSPLARPVMVFQVTVSSVARVRSRFMWASTAPASSEWTLFIMMGMR